MTTQRKLLDAMWEVIAQSTTPWTEKRKVKSAWKKLLAANQKTKVVVKLGNGHWLASSDSRPGDFHSVEYVGASDYRCSCEDAQLNKNDQCHHVDTIREVEQHI